MRRRSSLIGLNSVRQLCSLRAPRWAQAVKNVELPLGEVRPFHLEIEFAQVLVGFDMVSTPDQRCIGWPE
jgi:hypothetical protein